MEKYEDIRMKELGTRDELIKNPYFNVIDCNDDEISLKSHLFRARNYNLFRKKIVF